jgi:UDP-3-O-[3-hydroxymyristoyl] glucosamine N-acyltransferase
MKTLGEIASYVGGRLRGDPSVTIKRVIHPALAQDPSDLALVLSPAATSILASGNVSNAVTPEELGEQPTPNQIIVKRPRLALAKLLELFERPVHVFDGIHPSAVIDPSAVIGEKVSIGPFCWVGPASKIGDSCRLVARVSIGADVTVGEKTLLHAGVCIGDRCQIGARVIIQANATIGGDGFSFVTVEPGSIESAQATGEVRSFNDEIVRINSIGNVVIEDDVEIGAGTCVDRGTLGETRIGKGSKLDNLVQVGHNATIGTNCLIAAQVGLGGSSKVGERAVMGGQSGLPDHVSVGEDALIHAQAGIGANIPPKGIVIGSPAEPKKQWLEEHLAIRRLPRIARELKELRQQVANLTEKLNSLEPERPSDTQESQNSGVRSQELQNARPRGGNIQIDGLQ